jgi:hypothetical protein
MKKLAILLMVFSAGLFTLGCNPPSGPSKTESTKTESKKTEEKKTDTATTPPPAETPAPPK